MREKTQRAIPALDGLRGYAFLIVFFVHYQAVTVRPINICQYPLFYFMNTAWIAVPVFFALSGYLITDLLYDSKGREGYFKVFYGRRSLRIFPLYYLVLFGLAVLAVIRHWYWNIHYLSYFVYLQNLARSGEIAGIGPHVNFGHFWSLAVEEQFYLVWPVVIWFCSSRKSMLQACYGVLLLCFAARLSWPLFHMPTGTAYASTFTRVDGIICGAVISLVRKGGGFPSWFPVVCRCALVGGLLVLGYRAVSYGSAVPWEYSNVVFLIPLGSLVATAILVLVLTDKSMLSRVCSQRWIGKVGRLSYGLYVFHCLYIYSFRYDLCAKLTPAIGPVAAYWVGAISAFSSTWLAAWLAYRLVELPAKRAKEMLQYGPIQAEVQRSYQNKQDDLAQIRTVSRGLPLRDQELSRSLSSST